MVYYTIKIFNCQVGKITFIMLIWCILVCFAMLSCGNFVIFICLRLVSFLSIVICMLKLS